MDNKKQDLDQRRKRKRIQISFFVDYVELGQDNQLEASTHGRGRTKDISEGGLCLILPGELVLGAQYQLKIYIPELEEKTVDVCAEVCRIEKDNFSDSYFTGFKFKDIGEKQKDCILKTIE